MLGFVPIGPHDDDQLILAEGLKSRVLISWGDPINATETFGFNNDYIATVPLGQNAQDDALLWVNHEYPDPYFVSGYRAGGERTQEQVAKEQLAVGGCVLRVRKHPMSGDWHLIGNDPLNRRITGQTKIPIIAERPIAGSREAVGTLANCAGGVTPWQSILTCEENYQDYYGEKKGDTSFYGWEKFFAHPPEHYGWVVEVNPLNGEAKKLSSLGRFAHECATCVQAENGQVVVYSGDDKAGEHLYKFVSDQSNSLERGTLFVADLGKGRWGKGRWMPLDWKRQAVLKKNFKDQTDVLIHARKAAKLLGATPLDRPEDIEIDPETSSVLVALTRNKGAGNFYGSILKIDEEARNPLSKTFGSSTLIFGGPSTGFACPDNLCFDPKGNLWMTSGMSASAMGTGPYDPFQNNGLFVIPLRGPEAGQVFQAASAPRDAEFTGPCFALDRKTLFLSVQHPGKNSGKRGRLTSHWPEEGGSIPKPSVVAIRFES